MNDDLNVPLDKIVDSILSSAVDKGVKEVHIQRQMFDVPVREEITGLPTPVSFPRRAGAVVSFRFAGGFEQQMKLPHFVMQPLLARIQELSDAAVSDMHGFCEGRLPFEHGTEWYAWQVLVGPNELGDMVVLRQTQN